ncbi:MAG: AraC family transcriptional regulator [Planctomycetota bacterium]|jgi:AraC-like DNA-binding protein/mannose-6-phosphate isomerase-like protein (cupin superfamily)
MSKKLAAAEISIENKPEYDILLTKIRKDVELVCANYLPATPGLDTSIHLHPSTMHITCAVEGKGICQVEGKKEKIKPGFVHLVYPSVPHLFAADKKDPYTTYIVKITFDGKIPVALPAKIKLGRKRKKIESLFKKLEETNHNPDSPTKKLRETSVLLELFAELIELTAAESKGKEYPSAPSHPFAALLEKLQTPPFEFPGIDALAKECFTSRRTFTNLFREATGMSVMQFFLKVRMSYAKSLVDSKEYRIKEIARQCGYSNAQNFIRTYKKYFGYSPGRE